jgi:hypothetical protein
MIGQDMVTGHSPFPDRRLPADQRRGLITRARSKKRCAWISKAVETPEELIDELMGHTTGKPKYRDGYGLKLKLKYLQAIALTPPPGTLRAAA